MGRVNYFEFLKKFDTIWPKKQEAKGRKDEAQLEQEEFLAKIKRNNDEARLSFNLLDLDGDKYLSILDLVWLRERFVKETLLGK